MLHGKDSRLRCCPVTAPGDAEVWQDWLGVEDLEHLRLLPIHPIDVAGRGGSRMTIRTAYERHTLNAP
jgi:hypothetical protein